MLVLETRLDWIERAAVQWQLGWILMMLGGDSSIFRSKGHLHVEIDTDELGWLNEPSDVKSFY
jgi:hypothetical protein